MAQPVVKPSPKAETPAKAPEKDNPFAGVPLLMGEPAEADEAEEEAVEPEEATEQEETEATEEAQAPEEEKPEAEAEAEEKQAQVEEDAEVILEKFKDKDGNFDLRKAAKSVHEAQKLVGKTAKERERLNKLPQLEQAQRQLLALDHLVRKHPELKTALESVVAKERGLAQPASQPSQPTVTAEEVDRKAAELFKAGRIREAQALVNQHDPVYLEAKRMKEELAERQQQLDASNARERADKEYAEFQKAHVEDGLFDAKGNITDQEVHDTMQELYNNGFNGAIEDAHAVALKRLGRIGAKAKPDPARQQVLSQSVRAGRAVPRKQPDPVTKDEEESGLPLTKFYALGEKKKG